MLQWAANELGGGVMRMHRVVRAALMIASIMAAAALVHGQERPEVARALFARARERGFSVSVLQDDQQLLKIRFVRKGKTTDGFGLLNIKWDERVTWDVAYVRHGAALKLATSEGLTERKPPIAGSWHEVQRVTGDPPSWAVTP
jgi:hypothetical protein